ncbi:MAG: hypothetical protein KGY99_00980 [Phycisphaerae bacterium]|nr:hypothetical protein [Phycisphaerae bacterium]
MADPDRIRPYEANPFYWQYKGAPVVLLGGSVEDNLFQVPDVVEQLDTLVACGGNYVRCTMSSRDDGDAQPFERDEATGLYDLNTPGREYWGRFERFCELTAERDVIFQIELWDRFDYARRPWQANPYNPKNNRNYTPAQSRLVERIDTHPAHNESRFFYTVPDLDDNQLVLGYQQAQVDELLRRSLPYGNALYCMDNETCGDPAWSAYWSQYIAQRASEAGVDVHTTEMWDAHDITMPEHESTWKHPETYSFCDISQNNHSPASRHWDNMQWFRRQIADSGHVRPINTVKIYGANTGAYGNGRDGQERFWRNILGGLAGTRFHRPASGLGLSQTARRHIRSMRMLLSEMDITTCRPSNELLERRSWNEAYCTANPGAEYAVFFTDGGDLKLDVSAAAGDAPLSVRWLEIPACAWQPAQQAEPEDGRVRLVTPRETGYWAALVTTS